MRLFILWLMCAVVECVFAGGSGFSELAYQDALKQAEKEQKLVFVDVFAAWCPPCKQMDSTTFRDRKVVAWLKEKTVAIKVDGDAQHDFFEQFYLTAYPSLLLLNPDGSVLGRVVGYVNAETFLKEFESFGTETDPLVIAQTALKLDPMNFGQRLKVATLEGERNPDKGLAAFKSILVDLQSGAMKGDSDDVYLKISDLPDDESINFLDGIRTESMVRIIGGDYSKDLLKVYAVVAREQQGVLPIYSELLATNKTPEQLEAFHPFLVDPLRTARRFADLEALSPVSDRLAALREEIKKIAAGPGGQTAAKEQNYRLSHIYAEFLGQERYQEADALGAELLGSQPSADDYNLLAWSAYEAGSRRGTEFTYAKKAYELSKGQSPYIVDTYARLLAVHGQRDEARKLVNTAMRKLADEGRTLKELNECLKFIDEGERNRR